MAATRDAMVCVGAFAGAHGVRGLVKVKSFTAEPDDLTSYGPLSDQHGSRQFRLELTGRGKGHLLARVEGISDRDAAEALRGTRLYVPRSALSNLDEEEYCLVDLIGLRVEDEAGRPLGTVKAVQNFGGGDVIEVAGPRGEELLLPFTRAVVPVVDVGGGRLVVAPPREVVARREDAGGGEVGSGPEEPGKTT